MPTKYREIVVEGDSGVLKGFLWGFRRAKRIKTGLIFCADHPINTHHLKEILTLRGDYIHLITSDKVADMLVPALKDAAERLGFRIVTNRRMRSARFSFKFSTYSRDVARDLKRTLKSLPVSLDLYDFKPKERIDPSARGPELYSPVHDYEYRGRGKLRGEIEPLLKIQAKLDAHTFIDADEIELVY